MAENALMLRGLQAAALGLLAAALAGCAGGGDHFFTSSSDGGSVFGNLLAFNKVDAGPVPARVAAEEPLQCPQIEVLDGTAAVRNYAGADQSNDSVKYQYSMGETARECTKSGGEVLIKVGVQGRVLLGPAGKAGSFTVPIRVAVRRDSDMKPAASKLYQVAVTVAFGETQGDFTLVTEPLAVPFTKAHADEDYTILVGFDEHGGAPGTKAPQGKHRKGGTG